MFVYMLCFSLSSSILGVCVVNNRILGSSMLCLTSRMECIVKPLRWKWMKSILFNIWLILIEVMLYQWEVPLYFILRVVLYPSLLDRPPSPSTTETNEETSYERSVTFITVFSFTVHKKTLLVVVWVKHYRVAPDWWLLFYLTVEDFHQ